MDMPLLRKEEGTQMPQIWNGDAADELRTTEPFFFVYLRQLLFKSASSALKFFSI